MSCGVVNSDCCSQTLFPLKRQSINKINKMAASVDIEEKTIEEKLLKEHFILFSGRFFKDKILRECFVENIVRTAKEFREQYNFPPNTMVTFSSLDYFHGNMWLMDRMFDRSSLDVDDTQIAKHMTGKFCLIMSKDGLAKNEGYNITRDFQYVYKYVETYTDEVLKKPPPTTGEIDSLYMGDTLVIQRNGKRLYKINVCHDVSQVNVIRIVEEGPLGVHVQGVVSIPMVGK